MYLIKKISRGFARFISFPSKLLPSRWLRKMNRDQRRVFNLIATGIIVVLGTWVGTSLLLPDRSEASWWDDSWQYRMIVPISNGGTEQSEFQVLVTVDTASLIAAGKIQADCDDIRFTSQNGELLPYFQATACDAAKTRYWVKVKTIPAGDSSLYLYYGNASASSASNRDSTLDEDLIGTFSQEFADSQIASNHGASSDRENNFYISHSTYVNRFNTSWAYQQQFSGLDIYTGLCYDDKRNRFYGIDWSSKQWSTFDTSFVEIAPMDQALGDEPIDCATDSTYIYTNNRNGKIKRTLIADNTSSSFDMDALSGFDWGGQGITYAFGYLFAGTSPYGSNNNRIYVIDIKDWNNPRIVTYFDASGHGPSEVAGLTWKGKYIYHTARNNDFAVEWTGPVKTAATEPVIGAPTNEETGPGPIAYWKFDEGAGSTANDSTGSNNTGTLSGATWASTSECLQGKCLDFDTAQTDYVTASANTLKTITNKLTISAWVKWRGNGTGGDSMQMIVGNPTAGSFRFGTRTPTTTGLFGVYCGACSSGSWFDANPIPQNQWTHLVVTMDGSTLKMYQDGVLTKTSSYAGNVIETSSNWYLGTYSGNTYNWNGLIDELKVYPYALSEAQVQTDFNSGAAAVLGAQNANLNNGLIGYWKMDESLWNGTTGEIIDSSGNGNNLTATSATVSAGKFGNSGTFDGTEDYIEWASVPSAYRPNIRTRSYWIKPAVLNNNRIYSTIAALSGDGLLPDSGYHGRTYSRIDSTGKITIGFSSYNCTGTASFLNFSHTSTDAITASKWHHITEVIDYTNPTIKIYIDGKYQGANSQTGYSCSSNENNVWIGRRKTNNDFNGQMDEFRLYNRELSANEVQQLYNFAPLPVAYYDFEEGSGTTVLDRSGNGNNSTAFGGNPQWVPGKYGSAISFDGNDYVRINQAIMSTADSTISFWMKVPEQPNNYNRILSDVSGGIDLYFTSNGTNGLYGPIGDGGSSGWTMLNPNLTGGWNYITLVSTASDGNVRAYLNGKLHYTNNKSYTSMILDDLYLGRNAGGANYYLTGALDELKIYNYARTPGQIIEDMNAGHPIGGSPVGSQLAYYRLDEGTGTTANDSVGSYHGTLSNATWTKNGRVNKAVSFNGTTSYIQLATDVSTINTYGGAEGASTVSMWINPSDNTEHYILYQIGGWSYVGLNSSGKLQGMARNCTGNVNWWHYGNAVIPPNQWTHITVELTGDGAKFYVNGKLDSVANSDTCLFHAGTPRIGYTPSGWDYYAGEIDEVKIYTTTLTEDQIKIDYNAGKSLQLGALGTESDGKTPSNSSDRAYCPPGDTTTSCGPIAEWKLDEMQGTTAKDTSGNGNNGTLTGNPTWYPNGKVGSALRFSGTNQYINVGDFSAIEQATVTFTAWIKPASTNTDDDILTKGVHTQNQPLVIWRDDVVGGGSDNGNTDALSVIVYDGTTQHWYASPSNSLNDTNWHHIAVAIVPGNYMKIYIDGQLVRTGSMTNSGIQNTAHNFRIGNDTNLGSADFDGLIDHVQVFNYELSPSQIAWNMNQGTPIAHFRFNECQGATVNSSISRIIGTINIGSTGTQTSAGTCQTAGTAWGNGANGKFGGSLNFDGVDDFVEIPSAPGTQFSGTSDESIFLWVKHNGSDYILYQNTGWNRRLFGTQWTIIDSASTYHYLSTSGSNDGQWHHVGYTYNSTTGELKSYVDGVLKETESTASLGAAASYWRVGRLCSGSSCDNFYNGQVDDLMFFNYALTPQQVKTIMNQGAIRFGP